MLLTQRICIFSWVINLWFLTFSINNTWILLKSKEVRVLFCVHSMYSNWTFPHRKSCASVLAWTLEDLAVAETDMATRTQIKWQKLEETKQKRSVTRPCEHATASSNSQDQGIRNDAEDGNGDVCSSGCATPKGKRFRIPEVLTCPPAPKKRRTLAIPSCSSKRSPVTLFASPDIELFFFSALWNVSAWSFNSVPRKYEAQFSSWLSK